MIEDMVHQDLYLGDLRDVEWNSRSELARSKAKLIRAKIKSALPPSLQERAIGRRNLD